MTSQLRPYHYTYQRFDNLIPFWGSDNEIDIKAMKFKELLLATNQICNLYIEYARPEHQFGRSK